ncbi:PRKC apoptosis WT1 regulator protein [Triplophysa rosa]|uniref:PRKC apoptosis WT1 regulator protein n=1 Tax=Triplophysa rosa TaxID=992332 RepID=A0A9W7WAL0_TRIRA|nr:PRKC apoptosis WT1 regulator protein [Triplophysa rosa]
MATGGFKSNSATDFLEEWKAKREKMRAKLLGDIAAATGRTTELNNNGSSVNCASTYPVARSNSSSALRRPEDEPKTSEPPGGNLKKTPEKVSGVSQTDGSSPVGVDDSDKDSPTHGKSKEKKSTGPSARKGKGQIEKRKLREKRRSTGVVSIPSNEDTPRSRCHKSDEDGGGNRHRHRHGKEGSTQERRIEELERELTFERQENARLLKAHQDKDELVAKLKEEIDLLNRDLDDIEDENEQLKQENKTLLKVVGQLTR